jgi:hypothetical protein
MGGNILMLKIQAPSAAVANVNVSQTISIPKQKGWIRYNEVVDLPQEGEKYETVYKLA